MPKRLPKNFKFGPIDYAPIMHNASVVFFGDLHPVASPKEEFIRNLPMFKEMRFTHLALEIFSTDEQAMVDEYVRTGDPTRVQTFLKENWGGYRMSRIPTEMLYLQMVEAARVLGLTIVTLDIPKSSPSWDDFQERNQQWAAIISKIVKREHGRVLVFGGAGHANKDGTDHPACDPTECPIADKTSGRTANYYLKKTYGIPCKIIHFAPQTSEALWVREDPPILQSFAVFDRDFLSADLVVVPAESVSVQRHD
jgi:hypothetical protein